jgi:hypothetical protein
LCRFMDTIRDPLLRLRSGIEQSWHSGFHAIFLSIGESTGIPTFDCPQFRTNVIAWRFRWVGSEDFAP